MVLGLSGKYCAGKSSVSSYLQEKGWCHIDVDRVGHRVLDTLAVEAARRFGDAIIDSEGRVDRRLLGQQVFSDPEKRRALESLLHPLMVQDIRSQIAEHPETNVILDAALLFPMGLDTLCDRVLIVDAPLLLRWLRSRKRDGISFSAFLTRNRAQKNIVSQARSSDADIQRVSNRGFRCSFYRAVERRLQQ